MRFKLLLGKCGHNCVIREPLDYLGSGRVCFVKREDAVGKKRNKQTEGINKNGRSERVRKEFAARRNEVFAAKREFTGRWIFIAGNCD